MLLHPRGQPLQHLTQGAQSYPFGQIDLADQQPLGGAHLAHGQRNAFELLIAELAIDQGDHQLQLITLGQPAIGQQWAEHRRRVGEACGFNHHPGKGRHAAILAAQPQILEGGAEAALQGAAQAAAGQQADIAA